MIERDEIIQEGLAHNIADVIENGPALRLGRSTWIEARCPQGHVLRGGLGAMGVGTMWCPKTERHVHEDGSVTNSDETDPTWADAPVVDSDECTVCHPIDWRWRP